LPGAGQALLKHSTTLTAHAGGNSQHCLCGKVITQLLRDKDFPANELFHELD